MTEPSDSEYDRGDEIVRCDSCSVLVRRRATQEAVRRHLGSPFLEVWCTKCLKNVDDNTSYALGGTDGDDPSTIGRST